MAERVNVDNFVRAETNRMFAGLHADAGAVNTWFHHRAPASVDHQTVIRMNRDTLYSFAIADISDGATLTVPEHGDRYVSVMIVNQDHYINEIVHDPGVYELSVDRHETPYVLVAARVLVDPNDTNDLSVVAAIQDGFGLTAKSAQPFVMPDYEQDSFDTTRQAVLTLAAGLHSAETMFGTKADVNPVHHLLGTAAGWGGLPAKEATYLVVNAGLPVGRYEFHVGDDVPVDAFWSISVYNADGFFEPNPSGAYSVNSITGVRDPTDRSLSDSVTTAPMRPTRSRSREGWNYAVRLYRPRSEILDGTWKFPTITDT